MSNERRPRVPADLAERIDRVRGDVPFERYVRRALERWVLDDEAHAGLLTEKEHRRAIADTHIAPFKGR